MMAQRLVNRINGLDSFSSIGPLHTRRFRAQGLIRQFQDQRHLHLSALSQSPSNHAYSRLLKSHVGTLYVHNSETDKIRR